MDHLPAQPPLRNVVIAGKHPGAAVVPMDGRGQALHRGHRRLGLASNDDGVDPDVVSGLVAAMSHPGNPAAVSILRERLPELKISVVTS